MIKEYFTDGLLQIAILLSILRTDLNNLYSNNFINSPEIQEIILGQSAGITLTDVHNTYNVLDSFNAPLHPKSVDLDYHSSVFTTVRSLNSFRRFHSVGEISAFLVSDQEPVAVGNYITPAAHNSNNSEPESPSASDSSSLQESEELFRDDESGIISTEEATGVSLSDDDDLSGEDMDLIEALYRQDIDLGVGKEVFDLKLRRDLERDRELQLLKERDRQREYEELQNKIEEDKIRQEQRWLSDNFTQDTETGEWLPINSTIQPTEQENVDSTLLQSGNLSEILENLIGTEAPADAIPQSLQTLENEGEVSNFIKEAEKFTASLQVKEENRHPQNCLRQDSLEQRWLDIVNVLNLTNPSEASAVLPNSSAPELESAFIPNPEPELESAFIPNPDSSTVLLHNATLPAVDLSNSTFTSITSDVLSQSQTFNSTVPTQEPLQVLNWESNNLNFTNISEVNQTESVGDFLELVDEDLETMDLNFNLNDDYQTIQMADEASSDSAVSMGSSSSPFMDHLDMSPSPYDGLVGATAGSESTSPSYDMSTKYDPDEYNYKYRSEKRLSDSSQTNCSTSSNDTDFNLKPSSTNHINHNHTYPTQPGMEPREVKKYMKTEKNKQKGPVPKDAKKAEELKLPIPLHLIINAPVEEFSAELTKYKLTEAQLALVRDIRRRGKNKVAAQNCRKRKLNTIDTLEDELKELERQKEKLLKERHEIEKQTRGMKEQYSSMYTEIFQSLRDENGHPYDPQRYCLQQATDGNVFLLPVNVTNSGGETNRLKIKKEDESGQE